MNSLNPIKQTHFEKYLKMADEMPFLECDGLSRVIAYEMKKDGYNPSVIWGVVQYRGIDILHTWIVIEKNIIDFRLKMWFGDEAPHGLIEKSRFIKYNSLYDVKIPSKTVVEILKEPFNNFLIK